MNQVDFLIGVIVAGSALSGARRGLVLSAGDIVSLLLGLVVGALAYPLGAAPVRWITGVSEAVSGALGFVIVAVLTVVLTGWGFSVLSSRLGGEEPADRRRRARDGDESLTRSANRPSGRPATTTRIGGALLGAAFGIFFAAIITMGSALLPGAAEPVGRSRLASSIVFLVPRLHESLESVGIPLPKLVQLPADYREELQGANPSSQARPNQGQQFLRINFTRLGGAMCINCRTPTVFEGYRFSRGTLMSPRFRCPNCGRTSDGCQTFEGFHAIYGVCPAELAEEGLQFDCGVWTNGWWVVPRGRCPVCGKEFHAQTSLRHGQMMGESLSILRDVQRCDSARFQATIVQGGRCGA